MQTQKEEIRGGIIEAAKEEFLAVGYRHTSMRAIAERVGITAGNIYAYFNNKESLLDAIVSPTMAELQNLISNVSRDGELMTEPTIAEMAQSITDVFLKNRIQFLILMNGCAGSKYEHARQEFTRYAAFRIETELLPRLPRKTQGRLLAEAIAESLLSGIFYLFSRFDGEEKILRQNMQDFLMLTLYHGAELL